MTLKNQNRLALYIFLVFVAFCFGWHFYRLNDLKSNGIYVQGRVTSDVIATKSSVLQFRYEFYYEGKKYENNSAAGVTNSTEFIGKTFPVRFSPESGRSEILITPRHYKRYGLAFPDSLGWVKPYMIRDF